jgi:outer membrane protein TolC
MMRARIPVLAFALACGGCAAAPVVPPDLAAGNPAVEDAPQEAATWWARAGEPVLARLVREGLAHDTALACDAISLAEADKRDAARAKRLSMRRLFAARRAAGEAVTAPVHYAHAALANRRAGAIAEAYIAARLAQARLVMRREAVAPWQDNAEIARFRREAGLVSAIDGSLAGVMVDLDADAVTAAETAFAQAAARLATATGLGDDTIAAALAEPPTLPASLALPDAPAPRPVGVLARRQEQAAALARQATTEDAARAALASATAMSAQDIDSATRAVEAARALADTATRTLAQAERAARDARAGYRAGTELFATLYVAEAAAEAAREAAAQAQAGLARAQVQAWTAKGLGWRAEDLTPKPPETAPAICPGRP